jgi:hypothetical protein
VRTILLVSLLVGAACGSPDTMADDLCGTNGECAPGFECNPIDRRCYRIGALADAALPDAPLPAPDAALGCPAPQNGPTLHRSRTVTESETWTADTGPHVIEGDLRVSGTATLTIEPCTEVELARDATLTLGLNAALSRLHAEGTADRPIRFRARDAAAPWSHIRIFTTGFARLAHVTLEGGGSDRFQSHAMISASGDGQPGIRQLLRVERVTVSGARGVGMRFTAGAGFADGSTDLTITGSGADPAVNGHAIQIGVQPAGTIPTGIYTGNRTGAFLLDGDAVVTESFTLRDHGLPYESGASTSVRINDATVTVEAGVTIKLRKEPAWQVGNTPGTGGALHFAGTADRPITLTNLVEGEPWSSITVVHPATMSLTHTVVENGGDNRFRGDAPLVARGDNVPPLKKILKVENVTVRRAKGAGIFLENTAGFIDGSTDLMVVESGGDSFGPALRVTTPGVGTVPPGSYTGNRVDAIFVDAERIEDSDTFRDRGVPYLLDSTLAVVPRDPQGVATLTIEPGVTLKFPAGQGLNIGVGSAGSAAVVGQLIAVGTPERPIVFTSAAAEPAPGDWRGLNFLGFAPTGNRIEHARIEYAGADCLCSGFGCSPDEDAGVIFYNYRPETAFIQNTTFAHIDGHGITSGWRSDEEGPDFTTSNAFEDIKGCAQVRWRPTTGSCPADPCY